MHLQQICRIGDCRLPQRKRSAPQEVILPPAYGIPAAHSVIGPPEYFTFGAFGGPHQGIAIMSHPLPRQNVCSDVHHFQTV